MFSLEYLTPEIIEEKKLELIKNLKEEQRTEIIFNGEYLYEIGKGHDFLYSFFNSFITLSGLKINNFVLSNKWFIGNKEYKYYEGKFTEVLVEETIVTKVNFEDFKFPIIKNGSFQSIADKIEGVKPIEFKK